MTTSTMDMIQQHLGDEGITQLTQHLGVDPNTAKAAAAAALPALINAMQSSQSSAAPGASGIGAGGLAGLAGGILGNIFGGNHGTVSQQVSHKTGLSLQDAEKALLFLAPIVLARLQQQRQGGAPAPATPSGQQTQPQGTEPTQPQADGDSGGLGGVINAVEKIFHR